MTIIIFIAVIVLLILVHEFGHFLAAKRAGVRVDEFGIGFPPRLAKLFNWGETEFTINAIPFGGFVKIHGENPQDVTAEDGDQKRSLIKQSRLTQAWVLFAGVFFNFLLAWLLLSGSYALGVTEAEGVVDDNYFTPQTLLITQIKEGSVAENLEIKPGDQVIEARYNDQVVSFPGSRGLDEVVQEHGGKSWMLTLQRFDPEKDEEIKLTKEIPALSDPPEERQLGVGLASIGEAQAPIVPALYYGMERSIKLTERIPVELGGFIADIFRAEADYSQVAGPVGIVSLVDRAAEQGLSTLLNFTAIISLHLAVINLAPFPALDGGRLLIVAIEGVTRKQLDPKVVGAVNGVGFLLLLVLMVVITINDIIQIFNG